LRQCFLVVGAASLLLLSPLSLHDALPICGGCFNLAMYCQGMTGQQIADNWRNLDPFLPVDLNWEHYWKLSHAPSLFTYDRFREKDRKSTRLNSSHVKISYAVFCFKKKTQT